MAKEITRSIKNTRYVVVVTRADYLHVVYKPEAAMITVGDIISTRI